MKLTKRQEKREYIASGKASGKEILKKFSLCFLLFGLSATLSPNVQAFPRKNKYRQKVAQTRNNTDISKANYKFFGCPGEEKSFEEVAEVLKSSEEAWNQHKVDDLLKNYSNNFVSKDGLTLEKIRNNLSEFWFEYPDAKIESAPAIVNVCGDYATVTLTEITTGSGKVEDPQGIPYPPKFKAWIRGLTTLKKVGTSWKIVNEEIISERMWKSYGPIASELLDSGKIKLVVPAPVTENENYIAQLKYSLPEKVQAIALLDKVLLTEFPDGKEKSNSAASKDIAKQKEIESLRRNIEGDDQEGLRRLFTANSLGQDELVRAQIELVSFTDKGPVLAGVLGVSERVIPRRAPAEDKSKGEGVISKTFREEAIEAGSDKSNEKNNTKQEKIKG